MSTTVRIPWTIKTDNGSYWNEVCAWAIERYGLPGNRFQTQANIDYMDFSFNDDKDALMFSLMWNGMVVTDPELTVEHVGRLINGF
jgi:hypothetical protein